MLYSILAIMFKRQKSFYRMKFIKYIVFIAILCVPFLSHAGQYRLSGSTSVGLYVSQLMERRPEQFDKDEISINSVGSGKGLTDLAHGNADIAMVSTPVDVMKARLPHLPWHEFKVFTLAPTYLAFIVHKDNPVTSLTQTQITQILNKEITNWAELGGKDQRIYIITEFRTGGVRSTAEEALLQGQTIKEPILKLTAAPQIVPYTARFENAFGIVTKMMVDESVVEIKTAAEIAQPLYFITKKPVPTELLTLIKSFQSIDTQQGIID